MKNYIKILLIALVAGSLQVSVQAADDSKSVRSVTAVSSVSGSGGDSTSYGSGSSRSGSGYSADSSSKSSGSSALSNCSLEGIVERINTLHLNAAALEKLLGDLDGENKKNAHFGKKYEDLFRAIRYAERREYDFLVKLAKMYQHFSESGEYSSPAEFFKMLDSVLKKNEHPYCICSGCLDMKTDGADGSLYIEGLDILFAPVWKMKIGMQNEYKSSESFRSDKSYEKFRHFFDQLQEKNLDVAQKIARAYCRLARHSSGRRWALSRLRTICKDAGYDAANLYFKSVRSRDGFPSWQVSSNGRDWR